MTDSEQKLSFLGHLQELRRRLIRSVIAVVAWAVICFIFYQWLFYILTYPAAGLGLYAFQMTERVSIIMTVCIAGGIILAMPILVYQGIMFVAPALTRQERRWVYLIIPWIFLMFLAGVLFGYFFLAPWTIWFLSTFGGGIASLFAGISSYISFLTKLLVLTGIVFETPVIATFLARIGILKPEWLAKKRPLAIIAAFIVGAAITPPDPITQCLLAIPLIILYEMSIWLARLAYRRRAQAAPPPETA